MMSHLQTIGLKTAIANAFQECSIGASVYDTAVVCQLRSSLVESCLISWADNENVYLVHTNFYIVRHCFNIPERPLDKINHRRFWGTIKKYIKFECPLSDPCCFERLSTAIMMEKATDF